MSCLRKKRYWLCGKNNIQRLWFVLIIPWIEIGRKISYISIKTTCAVIRPWVLSCVGLFCDPMHYSPPGSSVHGISEAGILGWVAISFSKVSFWPRDCIHVSCISRRILCHWALAKDSPIQNNQRRHEENKLWEENSRAVSQARTWEARETSGGRHSVGIWS